MKKRTLVLLFFVCILIGISIAEFIYSFYVIVDTKVIPYEFTVNKLIGINADKGLYFGVVPPGGIGKREIYITNTFGFPVKVIVKISGEREEWISVDKRVFALKPFERLKLSFYCRIPLDAQLNETYSGVAKIILKRI